MKVLRLDHSHFTMNTGEAVEMIGHLVVVPYIKAFAGKEGKYWYVYEYSTGLKITSAESKTKGDAVKLATDRLLEYGKEAVLQAISTKQTINK